MIQQPTEGVLAAAKAARAAFSKGNTNNYMPHMSLIYSDMAPESRRELAESVRRDHAELLNEKFLVERWELWSTDTQDKEMKTWKRVAEAKLK
eukprot:jgi/Chlat1/7723/Chrsp66S07194